jgi:anti-sigma factor ChrR (cupin superfamily)
MKEISVNANDVAWQDAQGYPPGTLEKILHDGKNGTHKTSLLRVGAGWEMNAHAHVFTEMHYVLEGEYESQGNIYPAGTFRLIPKETNHGPFKTRIGATILVMWAELHQ